MRCLVIGDIIGKPGRLAIGHALPDLRRELDVGHGRRQRRERGRRARASPRSLAEELLGSGVDVLTSGNHIWDKREIYEYLDTDRPVLRPANYPDDAPGRGWLIHHLPDGEPVAVINLMGRVFMNQLDSPFTYADALLDGAAEPLPLLRFVDFHCEITSREERDGLAPRRARHRRDSARTPTSRPPTRGFSPVGTAYISDVGMTGPRDSVIGFRLDTVLPRFLTPPAHPLRGGRRAGQLQRGVDRGRSEPRGGRSASSWCSA